MKALLPAALGLCLLAGGSAAWAGKGGRPDPKPELQKVAGQFRDALIAENWHTAMSLCTLRLQRSVRSDEEQGMFFKKTVPIEAFAAATQFPYAGGGKDSEGKDTSYVSFVDADDPYSTDTIRWPFYMYQIGSHWQIDFPDLPFHTWAEARTKQMLHSKLTAELNQCKWRESALGVSVRLTPDKQVYTAGEKVLLKMELVHSGTRPFTYDFQQIAVNNPMMIITNSAEEEVPYHGDSYQTLGGERVLKPVETAVLEESYEVSKHYKLDEPGTYTLRLRRNEIGEDSPITTNDVKIEVVARASGSSN